MHRLTTQRLKSIHSLLEAGMLSQAEIAREMGMTANALAIQLRKARKAGILPPTRMGRRTSFNGHVMKALSGRGKGQKHDADYTIGT